MKILFVIHEASRTGAPLFMLGLLKWLKREHKNLEFDVLLLGRGELETEFSSISKVYHWNPAIENICQKVFHKLCPGFHSGSVKSALKRNNYDLCYVNSVASCPVMEALTAALACPFLLHIHELESDFEISGAMHSFKACAPFVKRFIGVSNAVKRNLMKNYQIPEDKISVVPPVSMPIAEKVNERVDLKKILGLPDDAFVAGLCGTLCWRKGVDLLVPLIKKISALSETSKIYFVWVGNPFDPKYPEMLEYDLAKLGLADKVRFVGRTNNAPGYMAEFDVLLLLSREESFSLVAAEASALGKTVLCFENAIGWTEYASPDAYKAVPYLDLDEMAEVITEISKNRQSHPVSDSNQANYSCEKTLPELFNLIKNCGG